LRLQQFLRNHDEDLDGTDPTTVDSRSDKPIAELFSETTVMFADIAGFTAWSSIREPAQVFTLLESIYSSFDRIAVRRGVFKVETIGDSYVAVAGLPDPRADHAVAMAKFAREVREKMTQITKQLATSLGPDTADLQLRIGLNSGPVTAGVLRGELGDLYFEILKGLVKVDLTSPDVLPQVTVFAFSCSETRSIQPLEWKALAWSQRSKFHRIRRIFSYRPERFIGWPSVKAKSKRRGKGVSKPTGWNPMPNKHPCTVPSRKRVMIPPLN
jgi:hypothetical protein